MILEQIAIGTTDNDNKGEPLRSAFDKINRNFNKLSDVVVINNLTPPIANGTYTGQRKTIINQNATMVASIPLTSNQIIDIVWNGSNWIKVG